MFAKRPEADIKSSHVFISRAVRAKCLETEITVGRLAYLLRQGYDVPVGIGLPKRDHEGRDIEP
jgi:hypothetical protein